MHGGGASDWKVGHAADRPHGRHTLDDHGV
jgi:hypothetical protein